MREGIGSVFLYNIIILSRCRYYLFSVNSREFTKKFSRLPFSSGKRADLLQRFRNAGSVSGTYSPEAPVLGEFLQEYDMKKGGSFYTPLLHFLC